MVLAFFAIIGTASFFAGTPIVVDAVNDRYTPMTYGEMYRDIVGALQMYICCATVDDVVVSNHIRAGREVRDTQSIECVEYNHDAQESHLANVSEKIIVNNYVAPKFKLGVEGLIHDDTAYLLLARLNQLPVPFGTDAALVGEAVVITNNDDVLPALVEVDAPVGEGVVEERAIVLHVPALVGQVAVEGVCPPAAGVEVEEEPKASKVFVNCQNVREEICNRRISRHRRGEYISGVSGTIKNKLGVPKDNAANRLCVRRMAVQLMDGHGVRPSHQRQVLEVIISMVFIPDEMDILGAQIAASNEARTHLRHHRNAGPRNVYQRFWDKFSVRGYNGLEDRA